MPFAIDAEKWVILSSHEGLKTMQVIGPGIIIQDQTMLVPTGRIITTPIIGTIHVMKHPIINFLRTLGMPRMSRTENLKNCKPEKRSISPSIINLKGKTQDLRTPNLTMQESMSK